MHKRSAIRFFHDSFRTLFSKQFLNIAGSSLLVHSMMMLIIYFLSVYLIYRGAEMIVIMDAAEIVRFFVQGYILLFVMVIALLISRGWQAIIMPIRSIDHTKGLRMRGDIRLFHEHFGKYIAFFFWYSTMIAFLWILYISGVILFSAIHINFGILTFILGGIGIIRVTTRYSLSWYHMLSEDSGSLERFLESRKYTRHRIGEIFLKILVFGIILWGLSLSIELFLLGFLSSSTWSEPVGMITTLLLTESAPLLERMRDVLFVLRNSYGSVSMTGIVISLIYSLSSVITRAMYHIFLVHYYLQLRNEWEGKR